MKIIGTNIKNGRVFTAGQGTYEEVKSLNIEKDFDTALDVLAQIRKNYNAIFNKDAGHGVNRSICGKRKAS